MDKIKTLFRLNKRAILCIFIITIIGIISGSLFYFIITDVDRTTVENSIRTFFDNINSGTFDYHSSLKSGLIINLAYIFIIWLLGISLIGFPIILVLYFFKTFTLGFSIISIISNYGFKGTIYSFLYIFPHNIINVFMYAFLSIYAIICSFKTMSSYFKKSEVDFKPIVVKYRYVLIITLLVVILSCLYQTFIMPYILKIILKILN